MSAKTEVQYDWRDISSAPERMEVMTKVDTPDRGARNVQALLLDRNLWWYPDYSVYVYYTPTHWAPIPRGKS